MRRVSLVEFYRHKQMKVSVSRSSILVALAATVLLAALPGAIQRIVQTGDPYLFTQRFFEDVVARLSGAGRLRFILQPVAASLVGIRDGKSDAHGGRPAFLSALAFHGSCRLDLLRSAFASIQDLVAIAIILDVVSQLLIFENVHPGAALLLGPVLIAVPYSISRAIANRIAGERPHSRAGEALELRSNTERIIFTSLRHCGVISARIRLVFRTFRPWRQG